MAPLTQTLVCKKLDTHVEEKNIVKEEKEKVANYERQIIWFNAFFYLVIHIEAIYAFYMCIVYGTWKLFFYVLICSYFIGLGVTAGAHRLFSHKSYKAKLPLKIFLVVLQTMSSQLSVYAWAREHRTHHKYSETDADPHNPTRGIFFSHFGWLMCRKHPEVLRKGKTIDLSDLTNDKIIMFQHRYYWWLLPFAEIIPALSPWYFWGEDFWLSIHGGLFLRFVLTLNYALFINSFAHRYGNRPYDKNIGPADNPTLSYVISGEGWHNFHHVFPWDYRSSELGCKFNLTTSFIDLMAKMGLAYNLKSASNDIIQKRKMRTGDQCHHD